MEITYLGVSSGQSDKCSPTNLILDLPETNILVGAGPGVVNRVLSAGYQVSDFAKIIITHRHGDHTTDFPYVMFRNFKERLDGVEAPEEIELITFNDLYQDLMDMWEICHPPGEFESFSVNFTEVNKDSLTNLETEEAEITLVPVNHAVETFGFRVDAPSGSFSYSSDTQYCSNFVEMAEGSDLISHEAMAPERDAELMSKIGHGTAREAGKTAEEAGANNLFLHHVWTNYRQKHSKIIKEAAEEFSRNVSVPEPLIKYDLEDFSD